jgi:hypothetical protein
MDEVKWVHRAEDLEVSPLPPLVHWPGAVTGFRRFSRGPEVEFMASKSRDLVIIAANEFYYAISPTEVSEFIQTYNHLAELGSLTLLETQSTRPAWFITELSARRPVVWIFLVGGILNISLLIWTLLVIPARDKVSLGFSPLGIPHEPLESVRLILFPIINTTAYLGNIILGLFLYRNPDNRYLAYILWGGSLLVGILFHIGMLFILR